MRLGGVLTDVALRISPPVRSPEAAPEILVAVVLAVM